MPPMNCERAVFGLMTRPTPKTPSSRGRRTSPLSTSTRDLDELGAEGVARRARASALPRRRCRAVGPRPRPAPAAPAQAFTTAEPHDAVPIEPPAIAAWPKSLSPISIRTCSGSTPSASAAIWVEHRARAGADVRGGDPDRERRRRRRSARSPARASGRPGRSTDATPVPTSQRPSRRAPGVGSRPAQPKRSAPSRRQATRLRELNGMPVLGVLGRLVGDPQLDRVDAARDRELVHRGLEREHARALAGRAHPRRRRHVERDEPVRGQPVGAAYMWRVASVVCSANSRTVEVCSKASWPIAAQPAVARGAEAHALDRRRAVADHGEQLLPRQRDLHRAARRCFAAIAARTACGRGVPFEPKPPPTCWESTRTRSGSRSNTSAMARRAPQRALDRVVQREVAAVPARRGSRAAPSGCCARPGSCRSRRRRPRRRRAPASRSPCATSVGKRGLTFSGL